MLAILVFIPRLRSYFAGRVDAYGYDEVVNKTGGKQGGQDTPNPEQQRGERLVQTIRQQIVAIIRGRAR